MGGSVFFIVIAAVAGLALAVFATPLFLIPAVLFVLIALFSAPLLAIFSRQPQSARTTGLPTSEEASYEPVSDPGDTPA